MKSPRITLSIALLLSLPARVHAADPSGALPVGLPVAAQSAHDAFSAGKNYKWQKGSTGEWISNEAAMSAEASQSFFAALTRTEDAQTLVLAELGGEIEWRESKAPYVESSGTRTNDDTPIEFYQQMFGEFDGVLVEQKAATLADFKQDGPQDSFNAATNYVWQRVEINGKTTYVPLADGAALPTIAYYQQELLAFPESDQLKDSMFTELIETKDERITRKVTFVREQPIKERNEQLSNARSEAERLLLESGNYTWQPVREEGKRVRYAMQPVVQEQPAEPASSGWTSFIPSISNLFATAKAERLIDVAQVETTEAAIEAKNDAIDAIRSRGKTLNHRENWGTSQKPLVKSDEQTWEITRLKHPVTGTVSSALAPTAKRIHAYYEESELTDDLLTNGLMSAELALFKQSTQERALARKEDSTEARTKLLSLLALRKNLLLGTTYIKNIPACDAGLNFYSALSVKTAEQRAKILVQLRATESALSQELAAENVRTKTALNITANRNLIAKMDALTAAQSNWDITNEMGTTLALLPVNPLIQNVRELYKEESENWKTWWQGRWEEPTDAVALRIATDAIPVVSKALADAKEKGIGHLIDRYTLELAKHEEDKARLMKAIHAEVIEQTRALLLTDATILDACTRAQQLQAPIANLGSVIKGEDEEPLEPLASMLAALTADSCEEGRATVDAIRGLLGSSAPRTDLNRQKTGAKDRTAFTVKAQDPSSAFIDSLVSAVDEASANQRTYAQVAASSSSDAQSKPQPKQQPKKKPGNGKGKGHGPAKGPNRQ